MKIQTLAVALLLMAPTGCSMCSNCTDYSSPLADGPYAGGYGRAGSAFNGVVTSAEPATQELVPTPPPTP